MKTGFWSVLFMVIPLFIFYICTQYNFVSLSKCDRQASFLQGATVRGYDVHKVTLIRVRK